MREPIRSPRQGSAQELCKIFPLADFGAGARLFFLELELEPLGQDILLEARVGAGATVVFSAIIHPLF